VRLITIVTDVGGPVAMHTLLSELPQDFGTPIVVLHSAENVLLDSAIAALRHTTPLKLAQLGSSAGLHAGTVYFAQPGKSYQPGPEREALTVEMQKSDKKAHGFSSTLMGLARLLGSELTVVFLSGRGTQEEITGVCSFLEQCGCSMLVLSRKESVVDELGRCALRATTSACELSSVRIVDLLVLQAGTTATTRKATQKAAKQ
jgi:chemotaxis response regulator CheB